MLMYVKLMISDLEDLAELTDREFRLIIQACAWYVSKGEDPDLSQEDRVVRQAWRIMRAKMDACVAKVDTLTANGSKPKQTQAGTRKDTVEDPRQEQMIAVRSKETRLSIRPDQSRAKQSKVKQGRAKAKKAPVCSGKPSDIDIDIDKDKDIDKDIEREKEGPTLEEITRYQKERGLRVAPRVFYGYYSQRGWRTGYRAERIQDWRQLMELWEARLDEQERKIRGCQERPNDLPDGEAYPEWLKEARREEDATNA